MTKKTNSTFNGVIIAFCLAFLICVGQCFSTASATNVDQKEEEITTEYYMDEPDMGGYSHRYNGGTFAISTENETTLCGVSHFVLCTSSGTPVATRVSLYSSSFYPTFISYPVVNDSYINSSTYSAWVEAKVNNYSSSFRSSVYYGTHRFVCHGGNREF